MRESQATTQVHVGDVAVGDHLPTMVKNASRAQLFLYSAASFNPHRIHYDRAYAATEGHDDILVHGPLQGSWLTQYLTDWMGPLGRLRSVTWRNRVSAFPEHDLVFAGHVVSVDSSTGTVTIELSESTTDGQVLMQGDATVVLPSNA